MKSLKNIDVLHPQQGFVTGGLYWDNQTIRQVQECEKRDSSKKYVIPGFIDLQIYGAAGKLFSADPNEENLAIIESELLQQGCTGFYICLATNTPSVFKKCIDVVKSYRSHARNCMGLHLEGPFLNPVKSGAHVKEYIRKAQLDEIKALLEEGDGCIKMMTIAPELQDDEVIDYLIANGITLSIGHSDATFEQATNAYKQGIQSTTHLFNAMSPIHHRQAGIPTAVFNHSSAMASVIVDGLHVDFEIVKLASKIMKERLFLISDAVTECNTGPYQHHAVGGKYVLPNGTLSGSALSMLEAVKNCINYCDISLVDAIKMASYYPAKLIGKATEMGQLSPNSLANFLILDENLKLEQVFFKGAEI